jgi:modulator of FtsH protease HflK
LKYFPIRQLENQNGPVKQEGSEENE